VTSKGWSRILLPGLIIFNRFTPTPDSQARGWKPLLGLSRSMWQRGPIRSPIGNFIGAFAPTLRWIPHMLIQLVFGLDKIRFFSKYLQNVWSYSSISIWEYLASIHSVHERISQWCASVDILFVYGNVSDQVVFSNFQGGCGPFCVTQSKPFLVPPIIMRIDRHYSVGSRLPEVITLAVFGRSRKFELVQLTVRWGLATEIFDPSLVA